MGKDDIYEVYKAARNAIIVSRMEAVNHYALSRADLKAFIKDKGIASSILVPDDGGRTPPETDPLHAPCPDCDDRHPVRD